MNLQALLPSCSQGADDAGPATGSVSKERVTLKAFRLRLWQTGGALELWRCPLLDFGTATNSRHRHEASESQREEAQSSKPQAARPQPDVGFGVLGFRV